MPFERRRIPWSLSLWGALLLLPWLSAAWGCDTSASGGDSAAGQGGAANAAGGAGASGASGAGVAAGVGAGAAGGSGSGGAGGTRATAGTGGTGGRQPSAGAGSAAPDAGDPSDASTDAGTDPDAGSPGRVFSENRADFFGAARCTAAAAEVLLCEDFESEAAGNVPDPAVWTVTDGNPVIDDSRAARGTKSLHLHTQSNDWSVIQETRTFPAAGNTIYGRMFVWIDALPTAPQWAHWTLVAGNGQGDGSEIRIGGQWDGSKNRFGVGTDHGATGDWTNLDGDPDGQAMAVHEDEWMCLEWMYKGDSNELRFYWDGVEHPSLYASASDHGGNQSAQFVMPEFERLAIGWWLYHESPTPDHYDVWIDEVILDDERIGCVF